MADWWVKLRDHNHQSYLTLKSRGHIKSRDKSSLLTLCTRDQGTTWLIKSVIFQLPRDQWLPNLTEWWVLIRAYYAQNHITYSSRDHIRSYDLGLSNLTEGWLLIWSYMSNSKVMYPSDHAVTWGHVTNELHCLFIFT